MSEWPSTRWMPLLLAFTVSCGGPGASDAGDMELDAGTADAGLGSDAGPDAVGGCFDEETSLDRSNSIGDELFGFPVALSGDGSRAIVGAYRDEVNAGSARVFVRNGTDWAEEATLLAPDGAADDELGIAVALNWDGSRAVVGAHRDDTAGGANAGSARVFVRSGARWEQEAILLARDGSADDRLGAPVSLSADGSVALVGAHRDDLPGAQDAGSARVFVRTGTDWAEEAMLAPERVASAFFGTSIALSADGSQALVAAFDTQGTGNAHVFLRSGTGWDRESTLLAEGADRLAFRVQGALSADGDRALVTSSTFRADGTPAASARVFFRGATGWAEETRLMDDQELGFALGDPVALSADGSRALIQTVSGVQYFVREGARWSLACALSRTDGRTWDNFGFGVAMSGDGSRSVVSTSSGSMPTATVFGLP